MTSIQVTITRKPGVITPPPSSVQLYQYRTVGEPRGCASLGCPAVQVLQDAPDTILTRQWQYYLYAINLGMSMNAIIALMGDSKALLNNTGIGSDPPRANYLTGNNLTQSPPRLDKLRTFSLNTHTGVEAYRLTFALKNIVAAVRGLVARSNSFMQVRQSIASLTTNNALIVKTMDGSNLPPLKPGATYPNSVAQINPDDYLIMPQTDHEVFLDCNNVRTKPGGVYSIAPFANGLVRPWLDDEPHSFFPLASKFSEIMSPLLNWIKISLGSPFPSAFRRL